MFFVNAHEMWTRFALVHQEIFRNALVVIAGVIHDFGHGPLAFIVITGQAGVAREMWRVSPLRIVCDHILIGPAKPRKFAFPGGLIRFVNGEYHGREEWWLRAAEVVGPVCIEHSAIVLDLIEKVFDHPLRQFNAIIAKQTADDEIAVPAVHFVKLPAGYHVWMLQIKKSVLVDLRNAHLRGQMLDSNCTLRTY